MKKCHTQSFAAAHEKKRASLNPFIELDKVENKLKKTRDGVEESLEESRQTRVETQNLLDTLKALHMQARDAAQQEPGSSKASLEDIVSSLQEIPGVHDGPDVTDEPVLVYAGGKRRSMPTPRELALGGFKVKGQRESWVAFAGGDDSSTTASERRRTSTGELEDQEPPGTPRTPRDAPLLMPVTAPVDDPVPMPGPVESRSAGQYELTEAGASRSASSNGASSSTAPAGSILAPARSVSRGPDMMASFLRSLSGSFEGSFSEAWESDAANCSICGERFLWRRRRHNCRKCGRCVCHSCSPLRVALARPLMPPDRPDQRLSSFANRESEYRGAASFLSTSSFRMPATEGRLQGEQLSGKVFPDERSLFSVHHGYISMGDDLLVETMTVEEAKVACTKLIGCRGFTFKGSLTDGKVLVHFKSKWDIQGEGWTSLCYEPMKASISKHDGFISAGGDIEKQLMTLEQGMNRCEELAGRGCKGFTFEGKAPEAEAPVMVYFKSKWDLHGTGWTSYRFRPLERYVLDSTRFFLGFTLGPGVPWYASPSIDDVDDSIAGPQWGDVVDGRLVDEDWVQVGDRFLPTKMRGTTILVRVPDGARPAPQTQQSQAYRVCVWCQGPFVTAMPSRSSFC